MNNTVLKVIAGMLAIGAVIVAILGIRLSRQPPAVTVTPVAATASMRTEPVAVAARLIKAGQALGKADVSIKGVASPPQLAFRQTEELLGKVPASDIQPGTVLVPTMFATDTMASLLRPGERAFAVHVDEVIGVGGFAKPGDHVDVVSYQAASRETNDTTYAQIAVHNARLLSVGDATELDTEHEKAAEPTTQEALAKSGAKSAQEIKDRKLNLHSAVLAVAEADVTRLMLAANSGQLRLALRPLATIQPDPLNIYPTGNRASTPALQSRTIAISDIAPGASRKGKLNGIIIQKGSDEHPLAKNDSTFQP